MRERAYVVVRRWWRRLDTLVDRTPPERDRYVDLLRAVAIGVVVLWHWSLSVLYYSDAAERWVMPNPIHAVPGAWAATWLLQIVPVFFLVGGYANQAAWQAAHRNGVGFGGYYRSRFRRLLLPVAVFLAVWAVIDLLGLALLPGYPGVLQYGVILLTPLWFIGAYMWVVLLSPLTARWHAQARWWALGTLAVAVVVCDLGRFVADLSMLGWVNSALVWVLIHQLGYFFRDWSQARDRSPTAGPGLWLAVALVGGATLGLALLTSLPAYPRSMVATVGQERSNIFPTTAPIVVVALLQLGVVMLLRTPVRRWLRRRRVWRPVVAANAVIMTVFVWHMTALLVVLALLHAAGVRLPTQPDVGWWLQRPFWVVAPAVVLLGLIAIFGRYEWAGRGRSHSVGTMAGS
jgi:peptidoglycan/LPS O-acetylase OafA/YrhL